MENPVKKGLNWIDWLILGLAAAALVAGAVKFLTPEQPLGTLSGIDVIVKEQPRSYIAAIEPGDPIFSKRYKRGRRALARVEEILEVRPTREANLADDGRMVVSENPLRRDAMVRVVFDTPLTVYPHKTTIEGALLQMELTLGEKFWLVNHKYKHFGYIIAQDFQPLQD